MCSIKYRKWEKAVWVLPLYIHSFYCENGGGAMIESVLIQLVWLLFFGLIAVTVVAFALIIILVIILSK